MSPNKRYLETEELLEQARELRQVARALMKRTDALIEQYQMLSSQWRKGRVILGESGNQQKKSASRG